MSRKDFKTIAQLDQHLASKVHRKKAQDAAKKAKKALPTAKGKRAAKPDASNATATATSSLAPDLLCESLKPQLQQEISPNDHSKPSAIKKMNSSVEQTEEKNGDSDSESCGSNDDSSVDIAMLSTTFTKSSKVQAVVDSDSDSESSESGDNKSNFTERETCADEAEAHQIKRVPQDSVECAPSVDQSVFTRCEIITPGVGVPVTGGGVDDDETGGEYLSMTS